MVAAIPGLSPLLTTNAGLGTFSVTTEGFFQGTFQDDPAIRNQLSGGVWAQTETVPAYGGMAIYEAIPPLGANGADVLGPTLSRATNVTAGAVGQITGFSVFNQAINAISTPQSQVPMLGSGQGVNFFRLSSHARIIVQCSPSLVALDGGTTIALTSWDYNAQMLVPYVAAYNANALTAASYSTGTGNITFTTTTAHGIAVGNYFTIAGSTPSAYNGDYVALAGTTGSTLVAAAIGGINPGTYASGGSLAAGGGAVTGPGTSQLLRINPNGRVISYNSSTNYASWATGFTAEIRL